jgi:hypothetical protein
MDQQTYEITAPNGKVLSITGDHVPTEAELHDIFAKAGVDTGAKREAGISAAIPGTAYSPDTKGAIAQLNNGLLSPSTREHAQTFLTTPLAHPTGIPPVDSVTSPIGLIGLGTSAATVYKALTGPAVSAIGRAVAVARAAGHEITPTLKYEIAKSTLLAMGIPAPIAYGAATLVSGYRGNGKRVSPLEEAPPTADGYDRYMPNASAGPAAPTATSSAPAPKSAKLADTPVDASMEAIADRLAGGADQPSKGNGTLTARGSAAGETPPRAASPRRRSSVRNLQPLLRRHRRQPLLRRHPVRVRRQCLRWNLLQRLPDRLQHHRLRHARRIRCIWRQGSARRVRCRRRGFKAIWAWRRGARA